MNKNLIMSLLCLTAVLASCSSDDVVNNTQAGLEPDFKATTEMIRGSRTFVDADRNIMWNAGDEISIFQKLYGCQSDRYRLKSGEGTQNGTFSFVSPHQGEGTATDVYAAVYPYFEANGFTTTEEPGVYLLNDIEIHDVQTYAENNIPRGAMPMVSLTKTPSLKFFNICGVLKLQFTGDKNYKVGSIRVSGLDNESISGFYDVTMTVGGTPKMSLAYEGMQEITLFCPEAVALNDVTPVTFFIVMPVMEFAKGLEIVVNDENGYTKNKLKTKPCAITRNNIMVMPAIRLKGAEVDVQNNTITVYNPEQITPELIDKALNGGDRLKINGPLNGHDFGNLREAAGCSYLINDDNSQVPVKLRHLDLSGASIKASRYAYCRDGSNTPYSTYDNVFGDYLFYKSGLVSIKLPENITAIGLKALAGCASLTELVIPDGVTYIGTYAFALTKISSIAIPNNVTGMGEAVFEECLELTNVKLSNRCALPDGMFNMCKNLKNLVIPEGVEKIGNYVFQFSGLETLDLPSTINSADCIGIKSLDNANKLTNLKIRGSLNFDVMYDKLDFNTSQCNLQINKESFKYIKSDSNGNLMVADRHWRSVKDLDGNILNGGGLGTITDEDAY